MKSIELLGYLDGGQFITDLDAAIAKAIHESRNNNGTSKVNITLTIHPRGVKQMEVEGAIVSKLPERERDSSLFFVTDDERLSRRDPDQPDLPGVLSMPMAAAK